MILLCVAVALLLIAGVATASSAFLAQRDLQSWCDAAALATAGGTSDAAAYISGTEPSDHASVTYEEAAPELRRYLEGIQKEEVDVALSVQNDQIILICTRMAPLPFGRLFGRPKGIERVATSSARVVWKT
ncbi:hypothetical protein [Cryptosporangium phraense]|uniref:Flp pilus-assembly TadG-like N-terminal domain-containing protein n=1 Tax=Cryptosporangium phraense TaxID=2593070 RepID=A0A545ANL1_9ACTN|nr:hypothetical protein [Cryptosporangium phraense]TQS42876.1 hypothetical protein FL583_22795 [Cryptosporangium phraense]